MNAEAIMADVAGWQMVQRYTDTEDELQAAMRSAGICDITGRSIVRVKSFELDRVLGRESPKIGSIGGDDDFLIARLTAEEVLAIGPPTTDENWQRKIDPIGHPVRYIVDVTSGITACRIVGPRARDVIASLTDLDLREHSMPDRTCAQAGFAKVHGTLLRLDIANTAAYELYVAREYGVYVWELMLELFGHDGVVPFGNEALRRLEKGS
jgi:heterotetrameric sarcosine oxidase gamma subunit